MAVVRVTRGARPLPVARQARIVEQRLSAHNQRRRSVGLRFRGGPTGNPARGQRREHGDHTSHRRPYSGSHTLLLFLLRPFFARTSADTEPQPRRDCKTAGQTPAALLECAAIAWGNVAPEPAHAKEYALIDAVCIREDLQVRRRDCIRPPPGFSCAECLEPGGGASRPSFPSDSGKPLPTFDGFRELTAPTSAPQCHRLPCEHPMRSAGRASVSRR